MTLGRRRGTLQAGGSLPMPTKTRREFLTIATAATAAARLAPKAFAAAQAAGPVQVRLTAGAKRSAAVEPLAWHAVSGSSTSRIALDTARRAQPILGFGAAFTDAACTVLSRMPDAGREALLTELFDPSQM